MEMLHEKLKVGHEEKLHQKIEALKQVVYPKKKHPHLVNQFNNFAARRSLPKIPNIQDDIYQRQKSLTLKPKDDSPEKLKKTTIEFKSMSFKSNVEQVGPWTAQGWYPTSKSAASLRSKKPISFREAGEIFEF